MKAARQCPGLSVAAAILISSLASAAHGNTQLVLSRGEQLPSTEYKGVIELTVNPDFDDARVSMAVDGQRIADSLQSPYRVTCDFGPTAMEHKINVSAIGPGKHRVQWVETVNRGHLPLSVNVKPVDVVAHLFEATSGRAPATFTSKRSRCEPYRSSFRSSMATA